MSEPVEYTPKLPCPNCGLALHDQFWCGHCNREIIGGKAYAVHELNPHHHQKIKKDG